MNNRLHFEDVSSQEDTPATSGQNVQNSKRRRKFQRETEKPRPSQRLRHEEGNPSPPPGSKESTPASGGGPADKKAVRETKQLNKSKLRMEHTETKLDAAREKLAKQKPPPKPGIVRHLGRAVKTEAWMYVHGKVYQAEEENVGIKAAHRTELAGEAVAGGVSRFVKHRVRTRPARRVRKWENRSSKAHADYQFRVTAQEHPELKQNAVSRYLQKRRLRRQYQKQARESAKATATVAKRIAEAVRKIGSAAISLIKLHPASVLIALSCFLLVVMLQSCVGGALTVGHGILGAIGGTSYLAEDGAINEAELAYTQWETDLLLEARQAESSHPDYDEYRFDIDPVGHDPHALLSFLTAKYDDFTFSKVEPVLQHIFNRQYELIFTEIVEERSYEDSWTDEDGNEHSETVYYDYYILEATLTARPFTEVITPMLSAGDEQDRYHIYNITKGNRQYVGSPFAYNWLPYVTSGFGWRVHPITGARDFHRAVDIAVPEGTPILAGGEGMVLEATTHPLYGLTVKIDYGKGITARYSHCSVLLVGAGQMVKGGDTIAHVGNTGESTGPHLDLEVLKDGELLNPLYFVGVPF